MSLNFGSGISLGITAGGNKGKGYSDAEQTTYRHSHVGSKEGPTVVMSGGDTNIKGAQVTGKGITVRAANLNIESLQDTADYHSRQQNIKGQVTVGYGASASGDYSKSKINAEHRSVSEQSGLFAGEDGFDVQVGGHTQLTGGIITSAQSAEEQGKNRFQSGSISQTDLHNISKYDGSSIGFGTSVAVSGKSLGQEQQAGKIQLSDVASQNASGFSSGYGRDSDHQESTTKSGIGTRNIILTDEAGQLAKTGYGTDKAAQLAYTDIRSEDAGQQSGSLKNRFDAATVQNELDLQRTVSQEFSQTSQQVNKAINQKIDAINSELEKGNLSDAEKTKLEIQRDNWQYSKVLLNMVASGLSAPTQSGVGIAAATAAPAVSYEIGQYFKAQKQEGSLKHIVAHAILGAAVSAAGDNNALAGALSAGGSEAAAPLISQWLYQEADGSKLTAEQKDTVNAITSALGAATGAVVGGTATDVAQGSLNAGNAVENNYLTKPQMYAYADSLRKICVPGNEKACQKVIETYGVVDKLNTEELIRTCSQGTQPNRACADLIGKAREGDEVIYSERNNQNDPFIVNSAMWGGERPEDLCQGNKICIAALEKQDSINIRDKNFNSEKFSAESAARIRKIPGLGVATQGMTNNDAINFGVNMLQIGVTSAGNIAGKGLNKISGLNKANGNNTNITATSSQSQATTKNNGAAKDGHSFRNLGDKNPNNLGATKVTSSNSPSANNQLTSKSGTTTWTAGSGHVKATNNATESSQSQATRVQPKRPTPRESEIHVGKTLPPNAHAQVSYLNGKEVPYGTKGSVRPDWYIYGQRVSVEVKNYNIKNNASNLVNNIVTQAKYRAKHLPKGTTQTIVIDVRGQNVDVAKRNHIKKEISSKSGGIIEYKNIRFID